MQSMQYRIGSPFTGNLVVYNGDRDYKECASERPKRKILSVNRRKSFMNMRKYTLMHTPWEIPAAEKTEPYASKFKMFEPMKRVA